MHGPEINLNDGVFDGVEEGVEINVQAGVGLPGNFAPVIRYDTNHFKSLPIQRSSKPAAILDALRYDNLYMNLTTIGHAPFSLEPIAEIMATGQPTMPQAAKFDFVGAALDERALALKVGATFGNFIELARVTYPRAQNWGNEGVHPDRQLLFDIVLHCDIGYETLVGDVVNRLEDIAAWAHCMKDKLEREVAGEGLEATAALWEAFHEMKNWISFLAGYVPRLQEYSFTYLSQDYQIIPT